MPVTINGTTGETTPATVYSGSSSGSITVQAPAVAGTNTLTLPAASGTVLTTAGGQTISGTTTVTTLNSPAATALTIQSAGTTAMTIDTSQNVGIGTNSPGYKLEVKGASGAQGYLSIHDGTGDTTVSGNNAASLLFQARDTSVRTIAEIDAVNTTTNGTGAAMVFQTRISDTLAERMRIDSSGQLWVGYTSQIFTASGYKVGITFDGSAQQGMVIKNTVNSSPGAAIRFVDYLGNYSGGGIYFSSSNSISYSTTSDYRLKENIQPLTNGLKTIGALNPVSYDWKNDSLGGEGFLAHELQEVIPAAVVGEKDAVDADGNIMPQGVDYSKIVVHLVAAVKELSAKVDAQAAEIAALKAVKT